MKKGETVPREPLASMYGNWVVQGPAFRDMCRSQGVWKVPCVCCLHGTKRNVPESELRRGQARKCAACVRHRTAVQIWPKAG